MMRLVAAAVSAAAAAVVILRLPPILDGYEVAAWWLAIILFATAGWLTGDVIVTITIDQSRPISADRERTAS